MTETVDVTLTVVPPEIGTIAGRVYLQGRANHSGIIISINGYSTITNPDGSFSITVAPGTYTVTASMPGYLEATKLNVAIGAGEAKDLGAVTLLGGDASGDGAINPADLTQIAAHLNTSDVTSDINADGIVDILDLVLVGSNFGRTESPWE
ncbi:carboxypeptidase regulatory-like domain-containing protein [Dehalococcoidia bacterium]|nr:carboxypeptidase regulatory-like domain-containing protein [Dehalococcoidia bacterium]